MSIQVLVATMNQKDHNLLNEMNIQSDAIIANQCERNEIEELIFKGNHIKYLSFAERGVGLNRNNALMRAHADICILADDDMVFHDGYVKMIKKCFIENPHTDVIIFNIIENPKKRYVIEKKFKVGYHNYMRFGAARIAFRRKSITKCGITFNLHFGGGAEFSAGEDTLFLHDCLKNKLNILAVPEAISTLPNYRESSWFQGYTDKYFIDRGALFASITKRNAWLLCLQFAIRHRKMFKEAKNWYEAYNLMIKGIKEIKG
ncbi:glycosyltransferase [Peribacillus sp. NPDC006672]|uniref:glycosyltransferase n=1 Tax=Peribacillus sp. NPDC006672 TaxID=3390606 RepID=UPI003D020CA1